MSPNDGWRVRLSEEANGETLRVLMELFVNGGEMHDDNTLTVWQSDKAEDPLSPAKATVMLEFWRGVSHLLNAGYDLKDVAQTLSNVAWLHPSLPVVAFDGFCFAGMTYDNDDVNSPEYYFASTKAGCTDVLVWSPDAEIEKTSIDVLAELYPEDDDDDPADLLFTEDD